MIKRLFALCATAAYVAMIVATAVWLWMLMQEARTTQAELHGAAAMRAGRLRASKGPITVGLAGSWSEASSAMVRNGVNLAISEANSSGGIHGRRIVLIERNDRDDVQAGCAVAQQFADNPDVAAVIGHISSSVCLSALRIYEFHGIVMITPTASSPRITDGARRFVFRSALNDVHTGKELAGAAKALGYERIAVYHADSPYGAGLSGAFQSEAEALGVRVVDRLVFEDTTLKSRIRTDLEQFRQYFDFDAMLVVGVLPTVGEVVSFARQAGIAVPILGGDAFDSNGFLAAAGAAADGVIVASSFHDSDQTPAVRQFASRFSQRYGVPPDSPAAHGYDCAALLVHAMRQAASASPEDMADALQRTSGWVGVTGTQRVEENGDVVRPTRLKRVRNGRFEPFELPADASVTTTPMTPR